MNLQDKFFSNSSLFKVLEQEHGTINIDIDSIPTKNLMTREIMVLPLISGPLSMSAADYTYSKEPRSQENFKGKTSNKPSEAEIITKREYILQDGWHFVRKLALSHHCLCVGHLG